MKKRDRERESERKRERVRERERAREKERYGERERASKAVAGVAVRHGKSNLYNFSKVRALLNVLYSNDLYYIYVYIYI